MHVVIGSVVIGSLSTKRSVRLIPWPNTVDAVAIYNPKVVSDSTL